MFVIFTTMSRTAAVGLLILLFASTSPVRAQPVRVKPRADGLLPTEKLPGEGVFVQAGTKLRRVRCTIWFDEQFLGDGAAYSRRAKEFAKWKRRELRTAVVKTLKALSDHSYKAAKTDVDRLLKAETISNLERHWIINGFSCETSQDGIKALAKIKGVRAVFVRPAPRQRKITGPKATTFAGKAGGKAFDPNQYKHPWYTRYLLADKVWKDFKVTGKGTLNVVHDFNFVFSENLTTNLYRNAKEIPGNGKDDDGNGLVDDYHGYNFARMSPALTMQKVGPKAVAPRLMHGFMCANIICGRGAKGKPYEFGLAPRGQWAGIIGGNRIEASVEWAIEHGADTYSMSFSIPQLGEYRSHWRKIMEHGSFCGVCFVSGAGNFAQRVKIPVQMRVPEDIPNAVFAGTGVQRNFSRTPFSSMGPVEWKTHFYKEGLVDKPEVCAFNMGLPLLKLDGTVLPVAINGNSFAGPMTAGSLALMLSADPDLLPWDARAIITTTALDVGKKGFDYETGHGLINCYRAVKEVLRRKAVREGKDAKKYEGREKGDVLDIEATKKKLRPALKIVRVQPGSQAAKLNVKSGDIIVSYNKKPIATRQDLMKAKKAADNANLQAIPVLIQRGQKRIAFEFAPGPLGIFPRPEFLAPVFR